MAQFPSVDPIPLPAPIWLFKLLHNVTFVLHLLSVELLIGGLMIGLLLAALGRMQPSSELTHAAGALAHRLPALMAFVINLGVPPLLFAQVLYGRALYTSSVLIGAFWISVIFLLMASYFGLYMAAKRADARRNWTAPGLAALVLVLTIAFIYTNNMTLMLRPQVWSSMYQSSPGGVQLNLDDPTLLARWFFFLAGAFPATGAALALLGLKRNWTEEARRSATRWGGLALAGGILVQTIFGFLAIQAQPATVMASVMRDGLYRPFVYGWGLTAALVLLAGAIAAMLRRTNAVLAVAGAAAVFLNAASTVMVRDGIRDVTLRMAGFDVWDRTVVTNWSVVGLFLILFVAATGAIAYLILVVAKARPIEEKYA